MLILSLRYTACTLTIVKNVRSLGGQRNLQNYVQELALASPRGSLCGFNTSSTTEDMEEHRNQNPDVAKTIRIDAKRGEAGVAKLLRMIPVLRSLQFETSCPIRKTSSPNSHKANSRPWRALAGNLSASAISEQIAPHKCARTSLEQ